MSWHELLDEIKEYHILPLLDEPSLAMLRETCVKEWHATSPPSKILVTSESINLGYFSIVSLLLSRFNTRYLSSNQFKRAVQDGHIEIVKLLWQLLNRAGWKTEQLQDKE